MLHRILKFTQKYGFGATVSHAFNRAFKSLVPPVRQVFCANLAEFQPSSELEDQPIKIQAFQSLNKIPSMLLEELFLRGTIDNRKPYSRDIVTAFLNWLFSRGAVFWACFEDENLVGYLWSLRGSRENPRYHFFPLGIRDVVFLAHEIFPPYRGRELNRKMTHLVLGEMKTCGIERVYVDVEISNIWSLKSFSKTLFMPVAQARMKNFGKRQIVVWRHQKQSLSTSAIQKS